MIGALIKAMLRLLHHIGLVDQSGNNTFWTYDAEGRQTRKIYADTTHWDYAYDAEGRLTSRTDAKDQTTVYQYDAASNLTNINYPNDPAVSFTYDALNRKTSMDDGIGTTTYEYSSCCGLLESEDGPFANDKLYFSYTDARQLASITSAFQNVAYTYDNLQRLETVTGPEGTNTYSYEDAGTVWRNLQLGNGTLVSRQYDDLLRLTNMVNKADEGVLSSFAISLDNADQRTQVIREDGTRYDYSYDAIGQLVGAHATLPDQTPWEAYQYGYRYDATGNPIEQDKGGLIHSNRFNGLNQNVDTALSGALSVWGRVESPLPATITVNGVAAQRWGVTGWSAAGLSLVQGTNWLEAIIADVAGRSATNESSVIAQDRVYAYDLNGNMITNGTTSYVWDDENRLIEVRRNGELVQRNSYDGLSRRRVKIEKTESCVNTNIYHYQDWLVLAVSDGAGNTLEIYTHGADLSGRVGGGAGGIGGILASTQAGEAAYYHYDFNGNIVDVSSSNQTLLAKYTCGPFGEVLLKEGAFDSRYQFSSKELDGSTGMNYYGYRYYSAELGRWINRDPIEERGGLNVYGFVGNDGLNRLDYLGNLPVDKIAALAGVAITAIANIVERVAVRGLARCPERHNPDGVACRACCQRWGTTGLASIGTQEVAGIASCWLGFWYYPKAATACTALVQSAVVMALSDLQKAVTACNNACCP